MLNKWIDIQKSPEYWEYTPQERGKIKANWFKRNIASTPEFQGYSEDDKVSILNKFSKYGDDVSPERTFWGTLGDIGLTAVKGAMGLSDAAIGIADIPTGGLVGRAMEEGLGYDTDRMREIIDQAYSPAQKAADERVSKATGFFDKAGAMVRSPSTIAHTALESAPSMIGGAGIARGLISKGVPGILAAAVGEGAVSAGLTAEDVRKQSGGELSPKQAGVAVVSGLGTGALSMMGGKLAQKLGIVDPDTMLAMAGANINEAGVIKRIVAGGISEGIFEELPQSAQEQVWQNAALDRPLLENVPESAASGLLAGAAMGGGFNILSRSRDLEIENIAKAETVDDAVTAFNEATKPDPFEPFGFAPHTEAEGEVMRADIARQIIARKDPLQSARERNQEAIDKVYADEQSIAEASRQGPLMQQGLAKTGEVPGQEVDRVQQGKEILKRQGISLEPPKEMPYTPERKDLLEEEMVRMRIKSGEEAKAGMEALTTDLGPATDDSKPPAEAPSVAASEHTMDRQVVGLKASERNQKPKPYPFDQTVDEYVESAYQRHKSSAPDDTQGFEAWKASDRGKQAVMDHELSVRDAVKRGISVRDRVLSGYPDLTQEGQTDVDPNVLSSRKPDKGPDPTPDRPELTYVKPSSVETPSQGVLNGATERKAVIWKRIKRLRQAIKDEPLGGNRQGLRFELLEAEIQHKDALRLEREAKAEIEKRANELGQTTIKQSPKNISQKKVGKVRTSAQKSSPPTKKPDKITEITIGQQVRYGRKKYKVEEIEGGKAIIRPEKGNEEIVFVSKITPWRKPATREPGETRAIGSAWIGNQWKPIVKKREIGRGKNKGRFSVTLPNGMSRVVDASAIKEQSGGAAKPQKPDKKAAIHKTLSNETGSSEIANDILRKAADLILEGVQTYTTFKARMYNALKDVWGKIKNYIKEIWDVVWEARPNLKSERGSIPITGVGKPVPPKNEDLNQKDIKPQKERKVPSYQDTKGKVTDKEYIENRKSRKNIKLIAETNIAKTASEIKTGIDKFTGSISTRLGRVSVKLKNKIRKLDFYIKRQSNDDMRSVKPLLKKARDKMSRDDYADWDYARKNSDAKKINELVSKYGLEREYKVYREVLDRIRKEAVDVGLEIGEVKEYAPRILKDSEGFLTAIGRDPQWGDITERLKDRARELEISIEDMSQDQKAMIVSNMILGGQTGLGGPPATKQRRLEKIPPSLNIYYMDSDSALMSHIYGMRKAIEARKFFGKIPKKVADIRKRLHTVQTKLRDTKKQLKIEKDEKNIAELEDRKNKLFGLTQEYWGDIEKYAMQRDFRDNISTYIIELIDSGEIKPHQENTVRDILKARFSERGAHGIAQGYKNLSYIDTMGSPISALTQIGDLAWSAYEGGLINTLKNVYKSVAKKSRITKEDVGLERIAQEFEDATTLGKAVSIVFKAVGLEKIDSIGKEALLNTAFEKYKKQASKQPEKLKEKIRDIFEEETDTVIQDLQNDVVTDNVKLLVYSRLIDFQPVALSEMPEKYLTAGNGRVFYMLKTFTLKQFDVYRNEIYNKLRYGDKSEKIQAMKNFVRLTMFFVMANAGADELKDWVLGRKTDFRDRVVDNALRLFGVSKYITWKARTEGVGTAFFKYQIMPPFKFVDSITKDISTAGDEKGLETVASIPVVGKLAYWHMGRGSSKREELWDIRLRRQKRKLKKIKEKMEKSDNPQEFRAQHRSELAQLDKINALQGRLNGYRKRINKLKKSTDIADREARIKKLTDKRIEIIKKYLKGV